MVEQADQVGRAFALGQVVDRQLDLPTGRPEAVFGHGHRRALPDHVVSQADPAAPLQLQAQAGQLGKGALQRVAESGGLEQYEPGPQAAGVGNQAAQRRLVPGPQARRQVHHEQVDGPTREERTRQPEALVRVRRTQHDQPAQVHASRSRLQRVEGAGEVQPGGDRALRLGFRKRPQGERRLARRGTAVESDRGLARQATRTEDRVERRETGRHDLSGERPGPGEWLPRRGRCAPWRLRQPERLHPGRQRQRTSDGRGRCRRSGRRHGRRRPQAVAEPDRRTPPARLQAGQGAFQSCARPLPGGRNSGVGGRLHGPVHDRTSVLSVNPCARAILRPPRGDVAQLGEHRVRIAGVRGSSPLISTICPVHLSLALANSAPGRGER